MPVKLTKPKRSMTPQKAVIYRRVSSIKQVREGNGLSSQETRCREFEGYRGFDVVGVFSDDITGSTGKRGGVEQMLAFLRQHRREGVVVIIDDISRLARDRQVYWDLRDAIALAGGVLESPSIKFGEDADSIFFESLMVSTAEHQRRKNAEQTVNRMRARFMNGFWVFYPPIGYRYEKVAGMGKLLVRNEPLATILAEAFEGYASGRLETVTEVKRFLKAQPAWPRNSNDEVHIERVAEIFDRSVYAGYLTHEAWDLTMVEGKHEPLISLATWQAVQEKRHGRPKVPTRKDINEDFPLRGFVTCGHCGNPLTACWSKGRSARYPYYLCDTRGCVAKRKSIRKDQIEGEFETILRSLKPAEGIYSLAFAMFRDLWDAKAAGMKAQGASVEGELRAIEKKIDQLLDRLADADDETLIGAYEGKIKKLKIEQAAKREQVANCGKPLTSFGETFRTAFDFLENPYKLWVSPRLEDRRAVLKLAFAENLAYVKNEGYRTANISIPFKLLGDMGSSKKEMVRAVGVEPTLLAEPDFESGASTNSTTPARSHGCRRNGLSRPARSL